MIVGDSGVGKTSIINSLITEDASQALLNSQPTNSVDIFFKKMKIKEGVTLININIWDFSGKLAESRVRSEFYRELHAVVYVFDLSNPSSFNNLDQWIKETRNCHGERLIPVLVGNKSDKKIEVNTFTIEAFRDKYKLNYYEVSVKDVGSVKKFFSDFAGNVLELRGRDKASK